MTATSPVFAGATLLNPTGNHYSAVQSASYPNSTYCQQPNCSLLLPNETINVSGKYAVNANGTGSIGGETVAVTNGSVTFYFDESPLDLEPAVFVIEQ